MGLIEQLPCYIAGKRIDVENSARTIDSIDKIDKIPIASVSAPQLRKALRFADEAQERLSRTPIKERIEVARFLLSEYAKNYRSHVCWGLAKFRGLVAKDASWMMDILAKSTEELELFVDAVFGMDTSFKRNIKAGDKVLSELRYKSDGTGALIFSSTMDGPPAGTALAHTILSGTHVILRPSWRDVATHFLLDILVENNLGDYAQLVRWPSEGEDTISLNKQLIRNVDQTIVFCSDETFVELMAQVELGEQRHLDKKVIKYGKGLPLTIVQPDVDLDDAAGLLLEGARLGNGKFCLSHCPVLVNRACYEELLARLQELSSQLKAGDPLAMETDLGQWEGTEVKQLEKYLPTLGGSIACGNFEGTSMDVVVLKGVPQNSPCLYSEFPGTLLALIPFDTIDEAIKIARTSLKQNHRKAWTAVNIFANKEDFTKLSSRIDSYHFLNGGITALPKFILPHQGSYFAIDLMRRVINDNEKEWRVHAGHLYHRGTPKA